MHFTESGDIEWEDAPADNFTGAVKIIVGTSFRSVTRLKFCNKIVYF